MRPTTGHGYFSNIDPAFPGNSLCIRISSDLNFQKLYFLITRASQYHHQQIPRNSMEKIFTTEIHEESHPVSTHIPVMYLTTQYFHANFHVNALLAKLRNTSTRGFLSV